MAPRSNTSLSVVTQECGKGSRKPTFRGRWSSFPWRVTLIVLTLQLALAFIVTLAAAAEMTPQSYILERDCYQNDMWKEATSATWYIMDSFYFFTPNLSFGAFTFTEVKIIDIT
jgi:hypothetical protein